MPVGILIIDITCFGSDCHLVALIIVEWDGNGNGNGNGHGHGHGNGRGLRTLSSLSSCHYCP